MSLFIPITKYEVLTVIQKMFRMRFPNIEDFSIFPLVKQKISNY